MAKSEDTQFKNGHKLGPGRPPGRENKATGDFKAAITRLLDHGAPYMTEWLDRVATGDIENGVKPDPGRALDLMGKLADFAAPRLARTELTGDKDNPLAIAVIERRIISQSVTKAGE